MHIARLRLVCCALFTFASVSLLADPLAAEDFSAPDFVSAEIASLKEQLENGLKARRPHEYAFIGNTVALVEQGRLPVKVVNISYKWSRRKNKKVPYPYFERSLTILAARIGVDAAPPTPPEPTPPLIRARITVEP